MRRPSFRFAQFVLLTGTLLTVSSCKKWLDKKPNQSLAVPSTLNDLQALLDNQKGGASPGYIEMVADNYYVTSTVWQSALLDQRLNYIWDPAARISIDLGVWSSPYDAIYENNLVLDLLPSIASKESADPAKVNSIQGTALFYRSFSFFQLAQLFCRPFSTTASTDPGIVLKLSSNVTERYTRATVKETYDRILTDLKTATELLPNSTAYASRPDKAAAYGALARVYLSMRDYINAGIYADKYLSIRNTLLDFNTLSPAFNLPLNYSLNPEVSFVAGAGIELLSPPRPIIDSSLYQSYDVNDLRKIVFFDSYPGGGYYWKGSYYSSTYYFSTFTGIATDEIFFIRAECFARSGNKESALQDLNTVISKRWKNNGSWVPFTASDAGDALNKILTERRKELLFRGLRWTDLRRFNLENAGITLKRVVNGNLYQLPPNDTRWVLLIPEIEVNRSGIIQNPR